MAKGNNMTQSNTSKTILEMNNVEAKAFLLKQESYCNFDLPNYFNFEPLLSKMDECLGRKNLSCFSKKKPSNYDDVNYKLLFNKDGKYAWRPLELIHPALYVSLVHEITKKENWKLICERFERFEKLQTNKNIRCTSIPLKSQTEETDRVEQILNLWQSIEQKSIEMALDYDCLTQTDITDCYGSIYTHSIAWALHSKCSAKKHRYKPNLIGNIIDKHLTDMSHGQTNGIPQGSVLMDFIAEILLGYSDCMLTSKIKKIKIKNYKIIRYRDDYKIFTNSRQDGQKIVKCLTETMFELGLKLNAEKTKFSDELIFDSIKADKIYWKKQSVIGDNFYWKRKASGENPEAVKQKMIEASLRNHLLTIYDLATQFSNSGSLISALTNFYYRLHYYMEQEDFKKHEKNPTLFISICTDIAYKNPKAYVQISAIISYLLSWIKNEEEKKELLKKVIKKFNNLPNTEHLHIWMQRIATGLKIDDEKLIISDTPLCNIVRHKKTICNIVRHKKTIIWNSSWLQDDIKKELKENIIIDYSKLKDLNPIIEKEEFELFKNNFSIYDS